MNAKHESRLHRRLQNEWVARFCHVPNTIVPTLGTFCVILSAVVAATTTHTRVANFMFAAGLLLHLIAWFDDWWHAANRRLQG
jgi:hypothetical protein